MFAPRLVLAAAEGDRTPVALALALDMLTRWNAFLMSQRSFPPLYSAGIRYVRENYRSQFPEDWLDAEELLRRRQGDCEDLACYRAAELQTAGEDARAVFIDRKSPEGRMFHILIERADGSLEDPSRNLGMTRE